jgi:porin
MKEQVLIDSMIRRGTLRNFALTILASRLGFVICAALLGIHAAPALAQEEGPGGNGITPPSIATSLPHNGDPTGLRKRLADHGTTFNLIYTNDVLANVHGGIQRGVIDQGKLEFNMAADFGKLAGWQGLSFYTNIFQIHNTGRMRRDYVGGINTIAAIEAEPATRLSELWLEQKLGNDHSTVRLGQLAADVEFFFSDLSAMFLQSDWATITAANLPSGGPAYPLSTPGARLKIDPTPDTSLLFAVFNGDPAGPGSGDEQLRNRYGLNFRIQDSPLVIAEAQFRTNQGKTDTGLARTLKLGAWGHFGTFDDPRFAEDGTSLADPSGSGVPARRRGNSGLYGVIDQQIYRPRGGEADSGVSLFSRLSVSPSDRSLIDFFVDGGIVFAGMIPSRPDDRFGASFIYARFSDAVRDFDRDRINFTGLPGVVRDYEANLEMSYVVQIIPGWTVQPMLTFVWHPNGDASRDATITGLRSIWHY